MNYDWIHQDIYPDHIEKKVVGFEEKMKLVFNFIPSPREDKNYSWTF